MVAERIRKTFKNASKTVKDCYYDPFRWSIVTNIAFFALGVKIAIECNGMILMPPVSV